MSLNLASTDACPMLLGSDMLSLPSGYEIRHRTLYDTALQAAHTIHPSGRHIIATLASTISFHDLQVLAKTQSVVPSQLYGLLAALHTMGALHRRRSLYGQLRACVLQTYHSLYGIRYAPYVWRATARPGTIATALFRASWPLMGACTLLCSLVLLGGWLPARTLVTTIGLATLLFLSSLYIHEITHARLIRCQHRIPVIMQCGQRFSIIHRPLHRRAEIITALLGPAAGLAICSMAALASVLIGSQATAGLCLLVGTFHLSSLLPWYGDGATLMSALTRRYHYAEYRKTGSET